MEMLGTPLFWILYVMFVLVAASGLVVTAQVAPIARDYKIAGLPVNFLFISSTVIVMAGIVDNILNGLARPTFGWVSDHIGRENTMAIVFVAGAGAYWALGTIGKLALDVHRDRPASSTSPGAKSIASSQRPAPTSTDRSSRPPTRACCTPPRAPRRFSCPAASWLQGQTGSWHAVFVVATIANLAVAAAALFIVKPMRSAKRAAELSAASLVPAIE